MTKTSISIAALYTLFAAFSAMINIGAQILSIRAYKGLYSVELSILIGIFVSAPLRYLLEKCHVFVFKSNNAAHDVKLFFQFSFMGLLTTIIFWGMEYDAIDTMRYISGLTGLLIGFYMKCQLNKKNVFVIKNHWMAL
jgi:hypothetical protein